MELDRPASTFSSGIGVLRPRNLTDSKWGRTWSRKRYDRVGLLINKAVKFASLGIVTVVGAGGNEYCYGYPPCFHRHKRMQIIGEVENVLYLRKKCGTSRLKSKSVGDAANGRDG